ncbi:MAG TPA: hypothetical protein VFI42_19795 [Thermomicrobiaceae bacterium]|nr:hypothetical protein [Thermomicrobiaceae bacterium]
MTRHRGQNYTQLVYDLLQDAGTPLTFQEIFDEASRRQPITSKNPKGTIRSVLNANRQLVNTGDRRYGYLPYLVNGSLLRLPLAGEHPATEPLDFSDELRDALWPSFFESATRKKTRPFQATLPHGEWVSLPLTSGHRGHWGTEMPAPLQHFLTEQHATAGDSLLIRVLDAEEGRGEIRFEPRATRDDKAIAERNGALADTVYEFMRKKRDRNVPTWELSLHALARGLYQSDIAPDALAFVLESDSRFIQSSPWGWALGERLNSRERRELEALRQFQEEFFFGPFDEVEDAGEELALGGGIVSPAVAEQALADLSAVLNEHDFASIDEANAFLQQLLESGGPPRRQPQTALERAQDLIYQAWQTPNLLQQIQLARQALEISPDCANAYVLLGDLAARTPEQAAEFYAQGVAAGERALGREAFDAFEGDFWGVLETRPYMRARFGLATALWAMGRHAEAIDHLWEMLRLNPGDNQGVRYVLLAWLLKQGGEAQVTRLLELYPDDWSAIRQYGRALHAFRAEGDSPAARRALSEALEQNRFVPAYLSGQKRLPRRLPDLVGVGDQNEAIYCASELLPAWQETEGALDWLKQQMK